ncbi:hypothetical protein [Sabulicella rubraurantiaca]|uniref:hypothetical protein n=1 Tax=Sabulicella rubraurantiaca TaxID=2811429 RepID=UPI001A95CC7A|nr:hypothetical protein [Sabulicella rubraurantiaca]
MPKPMTVQNHGNLGRLIQKWVLDPTSRPKEGDLVELKRQLNDADVSAMIDPAVTTFRFATHKSDELVLRLPPKDMWEEHRKRLETEDYNLPPFYREVSAPGAQPHASVDDKLAFDEERLGDYTIANCA